MSGLQGTRYARNAFGHRQNGHTSRSDRRLPESVSEQDQQAALLLSNVARTREGGRRAAQAAQVLRGRLPAAYGVVQYGTGVLLLGLGIRNHLFAVTFTCSAPSISLGGEPQEL